MVALISLSILGVFSMIAGLFNVNTKAVLTISIVTILGVLGFTAGFHWNNDYSRFYDMLNFDNYAVAFTCAILGSTAILLLFSEHFFSNIKQYITEYYSLIIFSVVGMIAMVAFDNLAMLFLGIEIMSVPLYILVGSQKKNLLSNESSLKYFLMGAFTTGILLMGITLIYGETGSFDLSTIQSYFQENATDSSPILLVGLFFLLAAMAFKVSAAPFHFWTPDVYQGSPTFITAFMSTVVKIAGFGAFFRLFYICFAPISEVWTTAIWVMAALTITIGSITAVFQNDIKRLLAYSSISHAGYMLISLLMVKNVESEAFGAIFYYVISYSISSIALFSVIMAVQKVKDSSSIDAFKGLAKANPLLGIIAAVSIASLAGLPPTAGFLAKFYILKSTVESGYVWLALIAVTNAIIGIFYYFKVLIAIYFKEAEDQSLSLIASSLAYKIVAVLLVIGILVLGIFPDLVYSIF